MVFPNFFIVGAPKCGTTSLVHYLSDHPQVYISPLKEPEYFATDFPGRLVKSLPEYLALFDKATLSHQAIGEASTVYLYSEDAISNIMKFQPEAKIIVMVRNPADLVLSWYFHLLKTGNEVISDFCEAWEMEPKRKKGLYLPRHCRNPRWLYYSEWGKIGSRVLKVAEMVPEKQLKVIVFDDFIGDTQQVYKSLLHFLGLPDDERKEFPVINEGKIPRNVYIAKIFNGLHRAWVASRVRFFKGKGTGLGPWIHRVISINKPSVDPLVRLALIDYYMEEIKILESFLGRDLAFWYLPRQEKESW